MSAEEHTNSPHDHGHDHHEHDHDDHGHDHAHDATPLAPLPPTPQHGFWKSLAELEGTAPHQLSPSLKEFPVGHDAPGDLLSRRNFFHLMGASMALAGVAGAGGCRRYEKEEIVPLARRPEDQIPGITQQYATGYDLAGVGHALLATAYEGRPIHLDGNPDHPFANGGVVTGTKSKAGASTFALASILHLYDPDRSQHPLQSDKGASMEAVNNALPDLRKALAASGAHVLSEANSSATVAALRDAMLAAYPGLKWHEYEPLSWDNERAGTKIAFGSSVRPIARLDRAKTIVTLDCDLFVEHPAALRYSRDFARSRHPKGEMNRLWSIESVFSNTGAMADHRLPLRSEQILPFVMELDAKLGGGAPSGADFLKEPRIKKLVRVLVAELQGNTGRAVLIAGRRQPAEVHALVAKLNGVLGAPGATLDYIVDPDPDRPTHLEAITALAKDLAANQVQTLIILGGNPVYDAPADLDFGKLLANVKTSVHLAEYANETSRKSTWHIPRAHFLEAWGDVRTWDGTIAIAQPLIAPMYGGLSSIELLSRLTTDKELSGDELIRAALDKANVKADWRTIVHDGVVPNTQLAIAPPLQTQTMSAPHLTQSQLSGTRRKEGEPLEVVFHYSTFTYDGRFANNAWLQETPDFLTKVTWDNYALVSPLTATVLKLDNDTMITVKVGDRSIELPCYTMPGQAPFSIGLVLGGGRTDAGRVGGREGKKPVGYNTYKVRLTTGFDIATNGSVTGGGASYELANIQDHWDYRPGIKKDVGAEGIAERIPELIVETTALELAKNPRWQAEKVEREEPDAEPRSAERPDAKTVEALKEEQARGKSLYEEHTYAGHMWGMAIDLNTCTGCNSCMVACQSENNVPVVGRREVINNREMSWIRIDRYFSGPPDDPRVVHQPIACQQCENAPCETVCPVGATQHSDEGLNDMAYNRCIGTRYCANNCPYKVRRFNFLDWNKEFREARNKVRRLLFNPDVTVRMRGVMEKCTFCVQKIQNAKIKMKTLQRSNQPVTADDGTVTFGLHGKDAEVGAPLPDGTIVTACQAACPTEAIVFGDLADKTSRVAMLHADARTYSLLPENYTKPRNKFLARVHNPNPDLLDDSSAPAAPANEGAH